MTSLPFFSVLNLVTTSPKSDSAFFPDKFTQPAEAHSTPMDFFAPRRGCVKSDAAHGLCVEVLPKHRVIQWNPVGSGKIFFFHAA
ncbi:MAG: hypothetical protein IPM97_00100 [Bdellovibrionaceae bacterium]|nr:hypothetical protein [Pseudobdellovibrionaceae bacterium]